MAYADAPHDKGSKWLVDCDPGVTRRSARIQIVRGRCLDGGPVIGIVSQILSKSGGFEGLGFAVTSNTAKRLLQEEKPFWLGFDGIVLTDELTAVFNLPQSMGVLVQRVAENSPAARLGLQPGMMSAKISSNQMLLGGDIILELVGIQISEDCYPKIRDRLSHINPGDVITVKVLRAGQILQLSATRDRRTVGNGSGAEYG